MYQYGPYRIDSVEDMAMAANLASCLTFADLMFGFSTFLRLYTLHDQSVSYILPCHFT